MTRLEEIIREQILQRGPMTLARFMELALYHPELGYYRRGIDPFGVCGDFYTAEQLQPVFGELVATYAATIAALTPAGEPFGVLELGAGRADLREPLSAWNYRSFDWNSASLPEEFSGLTIANEFFDAMPVHLLQRQNSEWRELLVAVLDDGFTFAPARSLSPALADYAGRYGTQIPEGGLLEVNLEVKGWMERLSRMQRAGRILVIDYGYSEGELARMPEGSLLSYRKHAAFADVLSHPGERDVTAHVNFSHLTETALRSGFEVESDRLLNSWILSVWDESEFARRWNEGDERWRLQWKQIFFGMGETFRTIELRKRL